MKFNINTDAAVKFTNTLEKMHRSALPSAIRATLNSAAFDVKQNTMPQQARQDFTNRAPNFFRANSKVSKADGWDVNNMQSVVGFTPGSGRAVDKAVGELEQQEYGGSIGGRGFIAMDAARGGAGAKPVRPGNRLSRIQNLIDSKKFPGTAKAQFIAAAKKAGKGGFVLGNTARGTVWRIDSIGRSGIKKTAMYSFRKGRTVRVGATHFMQTASLESANKMDDIYAKEAARQIDRLNK